jgi:hypothetical protein
MTCAYAAFGLIAVSESRKNARVYWTALIECCSAPVRISERIEQCGAGSVGERGGFGKSPDVGLDLAVFADVGAGRVCGGWWHRGCRARTTATGARCRSRGDRGDAGDGQLIRCINDRLLGGGRVCAGTMGEGVGRGDIVVALECRG